MNRKASAKAIPSTINRFLQSRSLLKSPPPCYYPLLAHPPPPSLVRSFPQRDPQDLPLQHRSPQLNKSNTRRKPPRRSNSIKKSRPLPIVFQEDRIRKQFYQDHPFEAYRPVSLVEQGKVFEARKVEGKGWTQLRQVGINPTAEDCISFISNLITSHNLSLSSAYPLGISQFRTLRSEHETSTLSARLQSESFGATFFGEIERNVVVEEKVLDEWVRAKEIQDSFAVAGGGGGKGGPPSAVGQSKSMVNTSTGVWTPIESQRPSSTSSSSYAPGMQVESEFSGGQEYLKAFRTKGGRENEGASVQKDKDGLLVGVETV